MPKSQQKHPLAVRWFHWVNFPVLAVMVWSGLLIYWANDVYHLGPWRLFRFEVWMNDFYHTFHLNNRLAEGMAWHFLFMWVFAINGLAYAVYTWTSGQWRHLLPTKASLREAWQVVLFDLKLTKKHPPSAKFNGAQRITYSAVGLMGFGSLLTGIAIYKPVQVGWLTGLLGGYQSARFEHFWLMMAFCLFFFVHVVQVARAGWSNFRAMITGHEVTS